MGVCRHELGGGFNPLSPPPAIPTLLIAAFTASLSTVTRDLLSSSIMLLMRNSRIFQWALKISQISWNLIILFHWKFHLKSLLASHLLPTAKSYVCLTARTTRVSRHLKGTTILDFNEARDDGVAVASAGPYASHLHLASELILHSSFIVLCCVLPTF